MSRKFRLFQCPGDTKPQCPGDTTIYIMGGGQQLELFPAQDIPELPDEDIFKLPYRLRIKETRRRNTKRLKAIKRVKSIAAKSNNIIVAFEGKANG